MASRQRMAENRIRRVTSGKLPETRSRAARNRRRNYLKEQEAKEELKEVDNATLPHRKGSSLDG